MQGGLNFFPAFHMQESWKINMLLRKAGKNMWLEDRGSISWRFSATGQRRTSIDYKYPYKRKTWKGGMIKNAKNKERVTTT